MALRLRPRDPANHKVGNAILYGGVHRHYQHPIDKPSEAEVFFVETDFGNHMTLTWREVEEMFVVSGWQDYEEWKANRRHLQSLPNLFDQEKSIFDHSEFTQ